MGFISGVAIASRHRDKRLDMFPEAQTDVMTSACLFRNENNILDSGGPEKIFRISYISYEWSETQMVGDQRL